MSEQLPNHDEQWDDMPLPDGEEAWQKMKLLLDKEDGRRRFLPLWFWRYGMLGLLLLGTAAGGYWLLNRTTAEPLAATLVKEKTPVPPTSAEEPETTPSDKEIAGKEQRPVTKTEDLRLKTEETGPKSATATEKEKATPKNELTKEEGLNNNSIAITERREPAKQKTSVTETKRAITFRRAVPSSIPLQGVAEKRNRENSERLSTVKKDGETKPATDNDRISPTKNNEVKGPDVATKTGNPPLISRPETADSLKQVATKASPDSSRRIDTVSATADTTKAATPLVVSNETKTEKVKKKSRLLFSAGVGLQQAIAFNGQQISSYNLKGKQNNLSDKIPSVYLRLQKNKWFLQGEFHYSVPQPVESFSFSQTSAYDPASAELRTERAVIQKLYYHQLPLSINYFVLPQWSVGAGGTYNLLAGAVTEQETDLKNTLTGSESTTSRVVPIKGSRDSFLYRSTVGLLLQTDYHWKRFSFGLRYTVGLQSFIKYTRPDGAVLNEKNQSLQAVLRFRIKG